jgi:two-component system LytT family response regulator
LSGFIQAGSISRIGRSKKEGWKLRSGFPIRTIIVDDEVLARRKIRALLNPHSDFEVIAECSAGRQAVAQIMDLKPGLLFLDIRIPEMDGFEVLRNTQPPPFRHVIITTAYDEYAVRAFEVSALDYLLKPFSRRRFDQAIARCLDRHNTAPAPSGKVPFLEWLNRCTTLGHDPNRFVAKHDGRISVLDAKQLSWIEAEGDYVRLHLEKRTLLIRKTMDAMERELDPRRFVRIHRSTIVSVDAVAEMRPVPGGDYRVALKDGTILTLSRNFKKRAVRLRGCE